VRKESEQSWNLLLGAIFLVACKAVFLLRKELRFSTKEADETKAYKSKGKQKFFAGNKYTLKQWALVGNSLGFW